MNHPQVDELYNKLCAVINEERRKPLDDRIAIATVMGVLRFIEHDLLLESVEEE